MQACSHIPRGCFRGGNIEDGTFHGDEFVGGFCCGDTPYTEADLRAPAEPVVIDPAPAEEAIVEDRSFSEEGVLIAA